MATDLLSEDTLVPLESNLAEIQAAVAKGLLPGRAPAAIGYEFATGRITVEAALRIHRNTIAAALAAALRLRFPTVDKLVGESFFDRLALEYVAVHPPSAAHLSIYGDEFPTFITTHSCAASHGYLPDVARLDLEIDRVAMLRLTTFPDTAGVDLGDGASLQLSPSLRLLLLHHPADEIREALDDRIGPGIGDGLRTLDLERRTRWLALWRSAEGVSVAVLSPTSAYFLQEILAAAAASDTLQTAFERGAEEGISPAAVLAGIRSEILTARFSRLCRAPARPGTDS